MKSLTLNLEGLRCSACADRVRNRLAAQPGVKTTQVSFEQAQARILYDPQAIEPKQIVGIVEDLGYRVPSSVKEQP